MVLRSGLDPDLFRRVFFFVVCGFLLVFFCLFVFVCLVVLGWFFFPLNGDYSIPFGVRTLKQKS